MENKRQILKEALCYLLAVVICLAMYCYVTKSWKQDLNIPGSYSGDSFFGAAVMKGFLEKGTYLVNNRIGAPYGANFNDFPSSDSLHYGIAGVLSLFTHKWEIMMRLIFIVSFPLSVISAMFVFRYFKRSIAVSIAGSVLFALLPYHFLRGINHLFLACYFTVPLSILIAIELMNGKYIVKFNEKTNTLKSLLFICGCILIGCSGIYYSFFSCFLFVLAGIILTIRRKPLRSILFCFVPVLLIFLTVTANLANSVVYTKINGVNPEVGVRSAIESELYGLKITQLLLPATNHRLGFLARIKDRYRDFPLVNENDSASLGIIGSAGFIALFIMLFVERTGSTGNILLKNISELNLGALLLSTIGGFGTVFAMLVTPKIRAYNRISVFIAFFSLLAVITLLDMLIESLRNKNWKYLTVIAISAISLIMIIGVADQIPKTTPGMDIQGEYNSDKNFVRSIEKVLPADSMVFQLPYVPFPENPPVFRMRDYDLFRGYLHSTRLKWSYGMIRGRPGDIVYRNICELPVDKMVEAVSLFGYSGVYIDRFGFADEGKAVEAGLQRLTKKKPLISENGRLVFFDLSDFNSTLLKINAGVNAAELRRRISGLNRINLIWQPGFYGEETNDGSKWRWCSQQGDLLLINQLSQPIKVQIEAIIYSGVRESSELKIYYRTNRDIDQLEISSARTQFKKNITLNPGMNRIRFVSRARSLNAGNDQRDLRFAIEGFKVLESD